MVPKIMLVDDDADWLQMMQAELADYSDTFSVVTAQDGQAALDMMNTHHVMMVVSDLRMPGIDGFELLNRIFQKSPDISVIMVTAYDRPKTREVVSKSGATDYLVKPFTGAELANRIIKNLKKKSEGGSLHNVSLETFLQLIEMEQQNCTLRVMHKSGSKMGVLFFKEGELMDARIGDQRGREAANQVLSWSGVSLSIENACPIDEKLIDGGLQAMLLDAMRTKDESKADFDPEEDAAPATDQILLDTPVQEESQAEQSPGAAAAGEENVTETPAKMTVRATMEEETFEGESTVESVRRKIDSRLGKRNGVEEVYNDAKWDELIEQATTIGDIFDAGQLGVIYMNKGRDGQFIVVPGEETAVVQMNPDTPRDRLIDALA